MKLLHEQVMGAVVIAGLIAVGLLITDTPELPGWLNKSLLKRSRPESLSSVTVNQVQWSADGKSLLCQSRGGVNALQSLFVYNLSTSSGYSPSWTAAVQSGLSDSSFAPDGQSVVSATHGGELWWIDLQTSAATELVRSASKAAFTASAIGHDGRLMAGGTDDGQVYLCDPIRGEIKPLKGWTAGVGRLRFSRDSRRLLCTRVDGVVSVWETATGSLTAEFGGQVHVSSSAAFLPDGSRIFASAGDDSLQIWDIDGGMRLWRGSKGIVGSQGVIAIDVAADGRLAAWGDAHNHRIVVWDLELQKKKFELQNPSVVLQLMFSPDGSTLAVVGRESVVRLYDAVTGIELDTIDVGRSVTS